MQIVSLSSSLYPAFYRLVQQTVWGNPMLPEHYNDSLWGDILLQDNQVVGGWIGTLRGNHPLTRWLTKSVYFDSYPIFAANGMEQEYSEMLVCSIRQHAQKDHIVMLNLTHWVRGNSLPIGMEPQTEATFVLDLSVSEENLWKHLEGSLRNKIRKAEKNGVVVDVLRGRDSLRYLADFQNLRKTTQERSVKHNEKTSMLLKSDEFFARKFMQQNATLFIGKINDSVVTASLVMQSGQTAYFYMSGSDIVADRTTGCSAYLKWRVIAYYCNDSEIQYVDMGGVPVQPDESHPAYGVYRFKKSFGGEYQESQGGRIVVAPVKYRMLNFLLSQRKLLRLFSKKM